MSKTVHIIGSGFSGMTLAYRLSQKGIPVIVYDKNDVIGGLISSHKLGTTVAEAAAPSISRTPRVYNFCQELGLEILSPSETSKNRFIFRDGVRKWPLSLLESIGLILKGAFAKLLGRLPPRPLETLQQWGQRNLGKNASRYTLETGMQGVYAGDASKLSSTLLLGPLFDKNRERFHGVIGFKNGMGDLFIALKNKIEAQGGKILLKNEVALSSLEGPVVIATSAHHAADLLKTTETDLSELLRKIEMLPLVTTTCTFPVKSLPQGFGCLIPRGLGFKTIGILINSAIFNRGWDVRSETWIIGGATEPKAIELSDNELENLIVHERQKIFADNSRPLHFRATRWSKALPHYTVDLEKNLPQIQKLRQSLEKNRQIFLHGNYLGGIGLSKILEQTDLLVQRIQKLNA